MGCPRPGFEPGHLCTIPVRSPAISFVSHLLRNKVSLSFSGSQPLCHQVDTALKEGKGFEDPGVRSANSEHTQRKIGHHCHCHPGCSIEQQGSAVSLGYQGRKNWCWGPVCAQQVAVGGQSSHRALGFTAPPLRMVSGSRTSWLTGAAPLTAGCQRAVKLVVT